MDNQIIIKTCFARHLVQQLDLGFNNTKLEVDELLAQLTAVEPLVNCVGVAMQYLVGKVNNLAGVNLRATHYVSDSYLDDIEQELLKTNSESAAVTLDSIYSSTTELILMFRDMLTEIDFNIVITDIETTGLSGWLYKEGVFGQEKHKVIQVAMQLVDKNLEPKADPIEVTIHWDKEEIEAVINPYVRDKMHGPSGLLDAVYNSKLPITEAENLLIKYLDDNNVPRNNMRQNKYTVLGGNSIHTDYAFLNKQMGRLMSRFSHQLLDFSSPQLLAKMAGRSDLLMVKQYAHTALDDVEESLAEGKQYLNYFKDGSVPSKVGLSLAEETNKFKD